MDFAVNFPINDVSFGQVSVALLREIHKRGIEPAIFPIGNVKVNTQTEIEKDFKEWLDKCIDKSKYSHLRKNPAIKLWHFQGGMESVTQRFPFLKHKTDSILGKLFTR